MRIKMEKKQKSPRINDCETILQTMSENEFLTDTSLKFQKPLVRQSSMCLALII